MNSCLKGRTVFISGSAEKLGAALALAFARAGANVALNGRRAPEQVEELAEKVRSAGVGCMYFRGDFGNWEEAERALSDAAAAFHGIDVLINNAGPFSNEPFGTLPPETWDRIMNVNLKTAYLAAKHVRGAMEKTGWGRIINISSSSSMVANHCVYGLAKAALNHLTASLALEFAPFATVNAIAPGLLWYPGLPEELNRSIAKLTPGGRLTTMEQVASAAVLLCTEPFDTTTGQVLVMDGGQSIPVMKGV